MDSSNEVRRCRADQCRGEDIGIGSVADGGHWAIQGEGARRVKLLARTKPKWADNFTRRDDVTL